MSERITRRFRVTINPGDDIDRIVREQTRIHNLTAAETEMLRKALIYESENFGAVVHYRDRDVALALAGIIIAVVYLRYGLTTAHWMLTLVVLIATQGLVLAGLAGICDTRADVRDARRRSAGLIP